MLFSQPQIAQFLSQSFECVWESVRPVPRVSIDFGNGHTLERTLHGNIVSYFCTPEGEVFDLVPGLVDPQEFLRRLDQAVRLMRSARLALTFPHLFSPRSAEETGAIEPSSLAQEAWTTPPWTAEPWRALVLEWHAALLAGHASSEFFFGDPVTVPDMSKARIERRIDLSLSAPLPQRDQESLREDSRFNREHRYPLASRLWLEHPFARPSEITNEVYRRVLDVDLEDPFLGLAPEALGGESGRRKSATKPGS